MQGIIGLVAAVWLLNTPWALAIVGSVILAILIYKVVDYARFVASMTRPPIVSIRERDALVRRVADLEATIQKLGSECIMLRSSNDDLQRSLQEARSTMQARECDRLFRRVGLHQDAPSWLIVEARRAYRSKLHPDRFPAEQKDVAESRFKEAEQIFDAIVRRSARAGSN